MHKCMCTMGFTELCEPPHLVWLATCQLVQYMLHGVVQYRSMNHLSVVVKCSSSYVQLYVELWI